MWKGLIGLRMFILLVSGEWVIVWWKEAAVQLRYQPYLLLVIAYTGHGSGFQELKRANVEILKNALEVVEKLCPKLEFWTLQTGGKVCA